MMLLMIHPWKAGVLLDLLDKSEQFQHLNLSAFNRGEVPLSKLYIYNLDKGII